MPEQHDSVTEKGRPQAAVPAGGRKAGLRKDTQGMHQAAAHQAVMLEIADGGEKAQPAGQVGIEKAAAALLG